MASVLAMRLPPADTHSANQQDGGRLDHSLPTSKLSRYDSGVVIDTQFHVNFSKIGNKDKD